MLTPEQIEALGIRAQTLLDPIQSFLIREIASRIREAGSMTATAEYQVWRLQNMGKSQAEIKKEAAKLLKISDKKLEQLMSEAGEDGYTYDLSALPQTEGIPFSESAAMQRILSAAVDQAREDLSNITQTLGFCLDREGKVCLPLTEAYEKACDHAFLKVSTGAQDFRTAVREAAKGLASRGIQYIDYESGIHTSLEAATRRSVMGSMGLMQERISQQVHEEYGCNGWEISAHACSAPDHEPIQGKQYSDAEYQALNGSLRRRIGTLNCGHSAHPILLGISRPQYSEKELQKLRQENEAGVEIDGKQYTLYETTQRQRAIERAMRKQKKKILVAEATGDPDLPQLQSRYRVLSQEYSRFSKAAGLRTQVERTRVANMGKKVPRIQEDALNGNTVANLEYIGSDAYRSKFSGTFKKGKYDGVLCKLTRRAIKENNGLETESYAFVADDGTDSGLLKSGRLGGNLPPNLLEGKKKNSVVFTHNHPRSTSFSSDDLYTLLHCPAMRTMIAAGHNGAIYKITIPNKSKYIDLPVHTMYNKLIKVGMSPHEAVTKLSKENGWVYEYFPAE